MTERDDRWQGPAAETADPPQAAPSGGQSGVPWAMAGAAGVLLLLVPVAFIVGWRLGRTMGRLRGY